MQSRLFIKILVLQAEQLVRGSLGMAVAVVNKLSPCIIMPFPKELALAVGHLSWNADLVTMEVVHGMFGIIAFFVTLRQRLIAIGMSINVSESAVGFFSILLMITRANLLHQV